MPNNFDALLAQFKKEDEAKNTAKVNDPLYQQWRPEFVPEKPVAQPQQVQQSGLSPEDQAVLDSMNKNKPAQSQAQAPKKNFLQQIADPLTDTLATGYRTVQGLGRGVQAIGQSVMGDKEGAAETMRKADEDIYKPVNIPLLGQGDIRRLGDVNEKGIIVPSKETLKTLGTGAELASFAINPAPGASTAAKAIPSIAKQRFIQGGLQAGGAELGESGDIGKATGKALLGGGLNVGFGKVTDKIADKFGKGVSTVTGKTEPNLKAQQKAIDDYASAIGIKKSFYTNEAKKAAGKSFKDPRRTLETLVEDGIELQAKGEGGRNIFNTVGSIESLKSKTDALEDQLQAVIASKPQKRFNLNVIATKAKATIKGLGNVTASEKNKMIAKIDDIVDAERMANGFKKGDVSSISRSAFIDGSKANQLKRGLYGMANFEKQSTGSDTAVKTLANVIKDSIENLYKGVDDVAALNKEYGRALEQIDFLTSLNGQVVQGGRLPKLASRALGAAAGMATPIPLPGVKEYVGSEIGGKLHDVMTDPARLTRKAIGAYQKASGTEVASTSAIEPIKQAVSAKLQSMGLSPEKQKVIMDAMPELTDVLMNAFNKAVLNPQENQVPSGESQMQSSAQAQLSPEDQAILDMMNNQKTAQ